MSDNEKMRELHKRIAKLTHRQAYIALESIRHGKSLTEALDIAETYD